jgi:ABC-type nitrate/sulfonate/bicarbonate transport system substrate-binding protein
MKRFHPAGSRLAVILVVPVLALSACGSSDDNSSSSASTAAASSGSTTGGAKKSVQLMLPYQESIFFIGELMAQAKGYFADEGLEVKALPSDGGSFVVQQVAAGKVKYGLSAPEAAVIAAAKGIPVRGIAETDRGTILIGVPADSSVQSMQDLKGKAIGISGPGGGEVGLVKLVLQSEGLTGSVKLLPVGAGGPAVYHALKNGRIAGYAGYTNDIAGIEAAGLDLRNVIPEKYANLPSDEFILLQKTLDNPADRDVAVKLMRAWNRGTQFALENPDEALKLACERVKEECQDMKVAKAFMQVSLDAVKPRDGKELGAQSLEDLATVQEGLLSSKQIAKKVDLGSVFTDDLIADINAAK